MSCRSIIERSVNYARAGAVTVNIGSCAPRSSIWIARSMSTKPTGIQHAADRGGAEMPQIVGFIRRERWREHHERQFLIALADRLGQCFRYNDDAVGDPSGVLERHVRIGQPQQYREECATSKRPRSAGGCSRSPYTIWALNPVSWRTKHQLRRSRSMSWQTSVTALPGSWPTDGTRSCSLPAAISSATTSAPWEAR